MELKVTLHEEIGALQCALRVNALRWGFTHQDVDRVIAATKKRDDQKQVTDQLL